MLHSEEKAWYACEGYLVLHARWFRGAGDKLLDALRTWAIREKAAGRRIGGAMILAPIEQFFRAHWLELAGFLATGVGIWLTARRNLLCWPITLAADVLYLVVFYRARLLSDSLLQLFFVAFTLYGWWHWWRGVRAEGEVRVVPLGTRSLLVAVAAGAAGSLRAGSPCQRLHAALPYPGCRADQLQPRRQLVAGAQTHRELVALDRGRC